MRTSTLGRGPVFVGKLDGTFPTSPLLTAAGNLVFAPEDGTEAAEGATARGALTFAAACIWITLLAGIDAPAGMLVGIIFPTCCGLVAALGIGAAVL